MKRQTGAQPTGRVVASRRDVSVLRRVLDIERERHEPPLQRRTREDEPLRPVCVEQICEAGHERAVLASLLLRDDGTVTGGATDQTRNIWDGDNRVDIRCHMEIADGRTCRRHYPYRVQTIGEVLCWLDRERPAELTDEDGWVSLSTTDIAEIAKRIGASPS